MKKMTKLQKRIYRAKLKNRGSAEKPRLSIYRSGKHIYAQIIDDEAGKTLVAASDLGMKKTKGQTKSDIAKLVGEKVAVEAEKKKVSAVIFDRGGRKYHGRVKALAEGARSKGLQF